ncbi:16261_t:CDS:1, partial [Acaulospora morrowiae]
TLEKPLCHKLRNPRYIYYIPNPSLVNSWLSDIAKEKKTNNRCHFDEEDNYFDSEFDNKSPNSEPKYDTYIEFFDEEDKSSKSSLPSLSITGPREIIRSSSPYLNIYNGDVNTLAGSVAEATDLKYDGCLDGEKSSHERIIHNMEDGIVQRLNAIEYGFAERLSNLENLLLSLKKA